MHLLHFFLAVNPFESLFFCPSIIIITHVLKFRKETSAVLQFNIRFLLNMRIQVRFDLAARNLADISWQEVARHITAKADEIANSETLLDAVDFAVGVLVKHRG